MADATAAFDLLKSHSGLIHRQPLFIPGSLQVDSYHLSFLDVHGQPLADDLPTPDFIVELPQLLLHLNHNKALLSLPESWQQALLTQQHTDGLELTLERHSASTVDTTAPQYRFADRAGSARAGVQTLLIDLSGFSIEDLLQLLPQWRQQHSTLCALNVNTNDQYQLCRQQPFDLLQGHFYTLPAAHDNKKIAPSAQILMDLLVKLQDPEVEIDVLAAIINQDVTLSYKLLRLINSAFFGLPRQVDSTQQAIVLLGQNKIKAWASLLCLSDLDDKPNELRIVAMQRARMCELLAKYYKGHSESFFAAGLFSTLDALMDRNMADLLEALPLSDDLKQALLHGEGTLGQALQDVLNYERGDWQALKNSPIPTEVLARIYLDAIHWARELNQQLND